MIVALIAAQAALIAGATALRKRAGVLRSLAYLRTDPAGISALAKTLSSQTQNTTRLERILAAKAAALIRSFVQTAAFEQVVLTAISHVRRRLQKGVSR